MEKFNASTDVHLSLSIQLKDEDAADFAGMPIQVDSGLVELK